MLREEEASPDEVKALDVSLTLYAEHEFNASTFTARVIVSTMADLHSGITGAIGALKGPLHGGANEKVMDVLFAAGGPDTAEAWIRAALTKKERIMGFGHRVYKAGDVRAGILKAYSQSLAGKVGAEKWETTADIIEAVMAKEKTDVSESRLAGGSAVPRDEAGDSPLYANVRDEPGHRLGRPCDRTTRGESPHSTAGSVHRPRTAAGSATGQSRMTRQPARASFHFFTRVASRVPVPFRAPATQNGPPDGDPVGFGRENLLELLQFQRAADCNFYPAPFEGLNQFDDINHGHVVEQAFSVFRERIQ